MSAATRVREAARDAHSNDDLVREEEMVWENDVFVPRSFESPLDRETLDEEASTQMGPQWEDTRRDAN